MSHPKRADRFKEWARMMLEQALVPERLEYKGTSTGGRKSVKGRKTRSRRSRKRFLRRKRKAQD